MYEKVMLGLTYASLLTILLGAIFFAFFTARAEAAAVRRGCPPALNQIVTDWSLILGLVMIACRFAHTDAGLRVPGVLRFVLYFWPVPWVIWFNRLSRWSLRR